MSKIKTTILVTAISSLLAVGFYHLMFGIGTDIDTRQSSIDKVKADFKGKTMYLNVFLNQPRSCGEIISELGLDHIAINKKIYSPTCIVVKDDFIRIIFEEEIPI